MSTVIPGTGARVRLLPDCPGDDRRPHQPAEDDCRVHVSVTDKDGGTVAEQPDGRWVAFISKFTSQPYRTYANGHPVP